MTMRSIIILALAIIILFVVVSVANVSTTDFPTGPGFENIQVDL